MFAHFEILDQPLNTKNVQDNDDDDDDETNVFRILQTLKRTEFVTRD